MADNTYKASDARRILKQGRQLVKRARKVLPEPALVRAKSVMDELEAAVKSKDAEAINSAAVQANQQVEGPLSVARKSKTVEFFESIGLALLLALALRGLVVEAFQIPSGSMEPTLLVGDHLFVAKFSYGLRVPFTNHYLLQWRDIERGDIVVFEFPVGEVRTQFGIACLTQRIEQYRRLNGGYPEGLPALDDVPVPTNCRPLDGPTDAWGSPWVYELAGETYRIYSLGADKAPGTGDDLTAMNSAFVRRAEDAETIVGLDNCYDNAEMSMTKNYIKRVIGLAGDVVEIRDGHLMVNGVPFVYGDPEPGPRIPQAPGMSFISQTETMDNGTSYTTQLVRGALGDFGPITVREGHVFTMGDNRDNSLDGRCWGQVPEQSVKGAAQVIFFSRDRRTGSVRWNRIFDWIH
jgi:signal peptidase I